MEARFRSLLWHKRKRVTKPCLLIPSSWPVTALSNIHLSSMDYLSQQAKSISVGPLQVRKMMYMCGRFIMGLRRCNSAQACTVNSCIIVPDPNKPQAHIVLKGKNTKGAPFMKLPNLWITPKIPHSGRLSKFKNFRSLLLYGTLIVKGS